MKEDKEKIKGKAEAGTKQEKTQEKLEKFREIIKKSKYLKKK